MQGVRGQPSRLFYGLGEYSLPFQDVTLCIAAPIWRTAVMNAGGSLPPIDGTGMHSFDMNAHIQSGIDQSLTAGTRVFAQHWSCDPQSNFPTGLTNEIDFLIQH
ncbi:MAG: hypothetical protein ACI835_004932 [Planctomycetota bacterium]|jgi:hypothetical protein